jgi:hypothetical protein
LLLLPDCVPLALTFHEARENRKSSVPPPPDGLAALNNLLDLGDVPQDILDGTFELTNQSKEPVRIVRIDLSCRNCIQVDATGNVIASGETVQILMIIWL